jgi:hypothetical protein
MTGLRESGQREARPPSVRTGAGLTPSASLALVTPVSASSQVRSIRGRGCRRSWAAAWVPWVKVPWVKAAGRSGRGSPRVGYRWCRRAGCRRGVRCGGGERGRGDLGRSGRGRGEDGVQQPVGPEPDDVVAAREFCSVVLSIAQFGSTRSINAGAAAAIAMHAWIRTRATADQAPARSALRTR